MTQFYTPFLTHIICFFILRGVDYMRVERVSHNQFTIFLTFDDLIDRGFTRDDLWHDASSVQDLFSDMMYEASDELGIELEGMLFVQVFLMQAQGMHICVTQKHDLLDNEEDFVHMQVTLDESNELIFYFEEFEDIIRVSSYLSSFNIIGGQVFHFDNRYYMILEDTDLCLNNKEDVIALMSEFSYPSIVSSYRLKEYGKVIFKSHAVKQITQIFN